MYGSHLSIAGNMVNALHEAESLGLDTVQVFTKNQRQWKVKPLSDDVASDWLTKLSALGWTDRTVAHASYLINLASPDDALWEKSIDLMREELSRCDRLQIRYLVSHPGAHMGTGVDAGLDRIASAYVRILGERGSGNVILCLEDTAGAGTTLGTNFEELASLRKRIIKLTGRWSDSSVGFCLDTCHLLAAGYDLTSKAGARATIAEFDRVCGPANLRVWHLNDSRGERGSHRDRHEHIGDGNVAKSAFGVIVCDARFAQVPKILETPKGQTPKGTPWDTLNLRRLRKLADAKPAARGTKRPASRRKTQPGTLA